MKGQGPDDREAVREYNLGGIGAIEELGFGRVNS